MHQMPFRGQLSNNPIRRRLFPHGSPNPNLKTSVENSKALDQWYDFATFELNQTTQRELGWNFKSVSRFYNRRACNEILAITDLKYN